MTSHSKTSGALEAAYSRMSLDDLLRLEAQKDSLGHSARQALAIELRKRRPDIVALAVAEAILATAIASAEKVEQEFCAKAAEARKFKDADFQGIVTEFVYLFLHLCDRDAFVAITDPQERGSFLDSIFNHVFRFGTTLLMTEGHPMPAFTRREEKSEPRIVIVKNGMDDLNERQKEYAPLPLFAAQDASLNGTVFWEFGKHIVTICSPYEGGPSLKFKADLLACAAYKDLIPVFTKMHEPPRNTGGFFHRLFNRGR